MTRRERLERKVEKRREWAAGRSAKAASAFKAAYAATAMIPMGQPILIGHHSEKRHRAAIARSDSAMGRAVESTNMAEHHESKASGLESQLDNSIFSDDPDAIEALEAKVAGLEAEREQCKALNKWWKKHGTMQGFPGLSVADAETYDREIPKGYSREQKPVPSYRLSNLGGVIGNAKKRIEQIKSRQARAAQAEEAGGQMVTMHGDYAAVTFAEKPARAVLDSLKAAGFHWSSGSWYGKAEALPEEMKGGA